MKREESYMNEFLSYVHMAANVYRIYQQKTADLRIKSMISGFADALSDHESKVKEVINDLGYNYTNSLKMMQKMALTMERLKNKMINDDFTLCMNMLKTTHMGIYQALNFIGKHNNLDARFIDVCENIIKEYDVIADKTRDFIENNYL